MYGYERGFKRGLKEIVIGFVLSLSVQTVIFIFNFDVTGGALFQLISMIAFFEGYGRKRYWHTKYLAGWLFAVVILGYFGQLMGQFELTYYLIGAFVIYARRFKITEMMPW